MIGKKQDIGMSAGNEEVLNKVLFFQIGSA